MVDHHLVFARCAVNFFEEFVNLAGEYIDSLYLNHIVGASDYGIDTRVGGSARTFPGKSARQVMCAVADERGSLLFEGCNYDLPDFSVRNNKACLRIYNFQIQVVIPIMHSALTVTADADTGPVDFRKSVYVI